MQCGFAGLLPPGWGQPAGGSPPCGRRSPPAGSETWREVRSKSAFQGILSSNGSLVGFTVWVEAAAGGVAGGEWGHTSSGLGSGILVDFSMQCSTSLLFERFICKLSYPRPDRRGAGLA